MALVALLRVFKPGTPGVGKRLAAVPRMLAATLRGEYDARLRLATMAMAALYLVSPLDLIADAIFLIVGVIGDAGLVTWLAGALLDETERFLEWERQRAINTRRPALLPASFSTTDHGRLHPRFDGHANPGWATPGRDRAPIRPRRVPSPGRPTPPGL